MEIVDVDSGADYDMRIYGMEYDINAPMEHHWLTYIGILWHVICYRN